MQYPFENRQNVCLENAVIKSAQRIFPGLTLNFRSGANNDAQIDSSMIFQTIPGKDIAITNSILGGKATELRAAYSDARQKQQLMLPAKQELIRQLLTLNTSNIYLMRTGINDGAGHFHCVYYNAPNWVLDSGSFQSILLNTNTQILGAGSDQLIDIGSEWGLLPGQRSIYCFEMNKIRTFIAARYIEECRQLSPDNVEWAIPREIINHILQNPRYLSSFGDYDYWRWTEPQPLWRMATSKNLLEASSEEYINAALIQAMDSDYDGAIIQLVQQNYFADPAKPKELLSILLIENRIDCIKKFFEFDLIDDFLSVDRYQKTLYDYAMQYSYDHPAYPPGLNHGLRLLQNKLLTKYSPENLPFTICDVCTALNADALEIMIEQPESLDHKRLVKLVIAAGQACHSENSTIMPLLHIIHKHQEQYLQEKVETLVASIDADHGTTPNLAWEHMCQYLEQDYLPPMENASVGRIIEYSAEKDNGEIIAQCVSESVQIALDALYAAKLQAEENNIFRLG